MEVFLSGYRKSHYKSMRGKDDGNEKKIQVALHIAFHLDRLKYLAFYYGTGSGSACQRRRPGTCSRGYPSSIADHMIERNEGGAGEEVIALYFDEDGLSPGQINEIQVTLNDVEDEIGGVEVKQLITPFDSQEQEELLSSDDGTAMIAVVELNMEMSDTTNIRSSLEESMEASGVPTLLTGSSIIEEDVIVSSEQGLATTEMITVIFVMFILLLVFRSIAAPLVPLITVGASYILAVSLVAFLVEYWNFPVSNFTQIFIVAVLFGIGTDYCILLLTRFKEELIRRKDRVLAMKATFKAVGPTVFYSGITGFIGFAAIGFADFSLYRSAVGVSVGILILLVALWVWVPALCCFLAKSCFGQ